MLPTTRAERGDPKERLDQLAKQATRRQKDKAPAENFGTKPALPSLPVQVRKLRDLDELEPERWSETELWRFEQDLEYLTGPYFGPLWRAGPRSLTFAEMLDRYVQQEPK